MAIKALWTGRAICEECASDLSCVHVQVLAVCIIQWERMRGCRSSIFLFLFWLLAVVCSLVPLRAKIQLAVDEVREMTLTLTHRPPTPIWAT